jgi:hypothetical protein
MLFDLYQGVHMAVFPQTTTLHGRGAKDEAVIGIRASAWGGPGIFSGDPLSGIAPDSCTSNGAAVFQSVDGILYSVPQTKDSAGIGAAIAHAASLSPGSAVFLPAGRYRIDAQVVVPREMTVRGAGTDLTKLEVFVDDDAVVTTAVEYGSTGWLPIDDVVLKNFSLYPSDGNAPAGHHAAIAIQGCVNVRLENILVQMGAGRKRRFGTGIRVRAWEGCLSRCVVRDSFTGYDLSWEDGWDRINGRFGCAAGTRDVELIGCRYETGETGRALPPVAALRSAEYCTACGSIAGIAAPSPSFFPTTVRCNRPHRLHDGDQVEISGCTAAAVNGSWRVMTVDDYRFAIPVETRSGGDAGAWSQVRCIRFATVGCHCLQNGADVETTGCANDRYNRCFSNVRVIDDRHFSVTVAEDPGEWADGGNPQATGQVIGCYIDGSGTTMIGCTMRYDPGRERPPERSVGVYARGPGHTFLSCRVKKFGTKFRIRERNADTASDRIGTETDTDA